jgi:hypothetical protein
MLNKIILPDPDIHWRMSQKVEKLFGRFLENFLRRFPPSQHHELLRLIADDCYAGMEKREDERQLTTTTNHETSNGAR